MASLISLCIRTTRDVVLRLEMHEIVLVDLDLSNK